MSEEKVLLGKALFWEEQISDSRTVACGTCHRPEAGGTDPRSVLGSARATHPGPDRRTPSRDDILGSTGTPLHGASDMSSSLFGMEGQVTNRRASSVIDAACLRSLPTDGRVSDALVDPLTGDTVIAHGAVLESQVFGPLSSGVEMAGQGDGWRALIQRLALARPLAVSTDVPDALRRWIGHRGYPQLFKRAFGTPEITPARIAMAIASYERTLIADRTPFDSVLAGLTALRPEEEAGRVMFDSIGCAKCHSGPLLTDQLYHFIGVESPSADSGRARVTGRAEDLGAFRTTSLRNVSLRRSYMHGGQLRSLDEVMHFYYVGGRAQAPNLSPDIRRLTVTRNDLQNIIAFLGRPLTDPRVVAQTPPFDRPTLFTESWLVPDVLHEVPGVEGSCGNPPMPVAVEPALRGSSGFTISVLGALGGAEATLVVSPRDPGLRLLPRVPGELLRRSVRLRGDGAFTGHGAADLDIPDRADLEGRVLHARWYVRDPGAPGGIAVSPPVRFQVFGPNGRGARPLATNRTRPPRLYPARYPTDPAEPVIRFDLFTSDSVTVTVEDSLGNRLRRLRTIRGRGPGDLVVSWDSMDSSFNALPRGRYYVRVSSATSSSRIAVAAGR